MPLEMRHNKHGIGTLNIPCNFNIFEVLLFDFDILPVFTFETVCYY